MHHFTSEIYQIELGAMQGFLRRAQTIYDENLGSYVKLVIRRPFAKILVRCLNGALLIKLADLSNAGLF